MPLPILLQAKNILWTGNKCIQYYRESKWLYIPQFFFPAHLKKIYCIWLSHLMLPLLSWTIASRCSFSYISRTGGGIINPIPVMSAVEKYNLHLTEAGIELFSASFENYIVSLSCVIQPCAHEPLANTTES